MLVALSAIAPAASAGPTTTYDFDDLAHGEIVSGAYGTGLAISGTNFNRSFDIIAAFDTRQTGTADRDLEGPNWAAGNLAIDNTDLGRVLMISENNGGAGTGFLTSPDDEGGRRAGTISFAFDRAIGSFGFDLVDIEGVTVENTVLDFSLRGSSVGSVSIADFLDTGSSFYDASIALGDNSANRFGAITRADLGSTFDEVTLTLGGSGAIDNIVIPATPTASLLALAGLSMRRRRR